MISYAQNFEDVMIARLFPRDHHGFYIDIGAADPTHLSVTKHFYDSGWSGVNVEPLPRFYQKLTAARPRDINLQAMIGTGVGERTFFEITELPENSTSDTEVMLSLKEQGRTIQPHAVAVVSLKELCERYAEGRVIDFMKIDVEGGELAVLQSADWQRFRPVLLVIEAVVVNGREETWAQWEWVVTEQGYEKVWFDGLNNYYLRRESLSLKEHFRLPPNVFDGFIHANTTPSGEADRTSVERHGSDGGQATQLDALHQICDERLAVIERLSSDLEKTHEVYVAEIAMLKGVCAERLDLIARYDSEVQMLRKICDERLLLIDRLQQALDAAGAAAQ